MKRNSNELAFSWLKRGLTCGMRNMAAAWALLVVGLSLEGMSPELQAQSFERFGASPNGAVSSSANLAPLSGPQPLAASQPVIQAFSPAIGAPGASVTITGANFINVREVRFNNEIALFTVASPQLIQATVPLDATTGPISVVTAAGIATTRVFFSVAPRILDFSPTNGSPGTRVLIEGANFSGATSVQFNGREAVNVSVVAPTQIHATVPAGASSGPIRVATPAGAALSANNFVIIGTEPVITDFNPTNGAPGTVVVIEGRNFTGATAVRFGGTNSGSFAITAPTQISATVPAGAPTGPISITTASGTGTSTKPFVVTLAPIITGFSPTNGLPGTIVTIDGFNFTGATSVRFGGTNAASYSVLSSTQVRVTVPTGAPTGPISVTTPRGTASSSRVFTITTAPVIVSFSPTNGPPGTLVAIDGVNFTGATNVLFGTNSATFNVVAPTQITAIVPANARSGFITVRSARGSGVSADPFAVTAAAPIITSFSPAAGAPGIAVVIEGLNFGGATAVRFNGTNALFNVTAPTQINCLVPEGATSGAISVTTPFGTAVSTARFIVAPRLTSFSPTNGPAGSNVIIRGTNFTDVNAVRFNGALASFTVQSANQLTAIVPTNAVTGTISVANAGGIIASTNIFVVLPRITGFAPAIGATGTRVAISGSHFLEVIGVQFNGVAASFTVISPGEIQAIVPPGATTGLITVVSRTGSAVSATPFQISADADLAVSQFDVPDPVLPGATLTYTVTVTNRGPASAGAVTLSDMFSANASFVTASVSQGSFTQTGQTIACSFGTLASGATAQLRLVLSPTGGGIITNSAQVTATAPDPIAANNISSEFTTLFSGNVQLAIQRLTQNQVALSWPASATNYVLQVRDRLSSQTSWSVVTNPPGMNGALKTLVVPITGTSRFYRLIRP